MRIYKKFNKKFKKAENILLDENFIPKICDFGWSAKFKDAYKSYCGTINYMSPETVTGSS